jgi:energy-coupling factor transporter ATP-binding protein EcfA2
MLNFLKKMFSGPIQLGDLTVYPEQQEAAQEIFARINRGEYHILLRAKPQCGKTTTFIYLTELIYHEWQKQSVNFKIYNLLALSDNELLKQTKERWSAAGFNDYDFKGIIEHSHLANFKKLNIGDEEKRLIIIDEAHIGTHQNSQQHQVLQKFGFDLYSGENQKGVENFIVSVSATSYGHDAAQKEGLLKVSFVDLKVSSDYYGLSHAKNRVKPAINILNYEKTDLSTELKDILSSFKNNKEGKRLVIRMPSRQNVKDDADLLKEICEKEYDLHVHEFHSRTNLNNLDELDLLLQQRSRTKPSVVIIYNALRAGKTLSTTKHIYAWVDTDSTYASTSYQSAGRLFGYKTRDGHSKFNDTFPIYANEKNLKEVLLYEGGKEYPPPDKHHSYNKKIVYEWRVINNYSGNPEEYRGYGATKFPVYKPTWEGGYVVFTTKDNDSVMKMSGVNRDLASIILKGDQFDYNRGIWVDAPCPGYEESFEKLIKTRPDFEGKIVYAYPVEKVVKTIIKPKSMFYQ